MLYSLNCLLRDRWLVTFLDMNSDPSENVIRWPHAPPHYIDRPGVFMVTASTYRKERHFQSRSRLRHLTNLLVDCTEKSGWTMQAWAVLSNHYHFVAASPDESAGSLGSLIGEVHRKSASMVNELDGCRGRQVWHNYWDTRLTYEKSYYARLNYVQHNPVKHGLVRHAVDYPWCSASWFAHTADPGFRQMVESFKIDRVNVYDDF